MNFGIDFGSGWLDGSVGLILLMMVVTLVLGALHYRVVERPERKQDIADEEEMARRQREVEDEVPL